MTVKRVKCLLVAAFSVLAFAFPAISLAQHPGTDPKLKEQSEETQAQMGNHDSEELKGGNKIDGLK